MVQRKGKAMYGFATNKTVRRLDKAAQAEVNEAIYNKLHVQIESDEEEKVFEDVKMAKQMGRKRMLKTTPVDQEELFPRETVDQNVSKIKKEIARDFVQGVSVDEDGKQRVIFKSKQTGGKIKQQASKKDTFNRYELNY